jgi:hypothetical protein
MPLEHKRFFRIGKLFFWIPTAAALAHSLRRARIISHGEFDSQNFRHSTNSDRFADIRKASLRASNRLMHCNKIGNFKKNSRLAAFHRYPVYWSGGCNRSGILTVSAPTEHSRETQDCNVKW